MGLFDKEKGLEEKADGVTLEDLGIEVKNQHTSLESKLYSEIMAKLILPEGKELKDPFLDKKLPEEFIEAQRDNANKLLETKIIPSFDFFARSTEVREKVEGVLKSTYLLIETMLEDREKEYLVPAEAPDLGNFQKLANFVAKFKKATIEPGYSVEDFSNIIDRMFSSPKPNVPSVIFESLLKQENGERNYIDRYTLKIPKKLYESFEVQLDVGVSFDEAHTVQGSELIVEDELYEREEGVADVSDFMPKDYKILPFITIRLDKQPIKSIYYDLAENGLITVAKEVKHTDQVPMKKEERRESSEYYNDFKEVCEILNGNNYFFDKALPKVEEWQKTMTTRILDYINYRENGDPPKKVVAKKVGTKQKTK